MKSDKGEFEFCKILCRNGHWRGPVCRVEIDEIKGMMPDNYAITNPRLDPLRMKTSSFQFTKPFVKPDKSKSPSIFSNFKQ